MQCPLVSSLIKKVTFFDVFLLLIERIALEGMHSIEIRKHKETYSMDILEALQTLLTMAPGSLPYDEARNVLLHHRVLDPDQPLDQTLIQCLIKLSIVTQTRRKISIEISAEMLEKLPNLHTSDKNSYGFVVLLMDVLNEWIDNKSGSLLKASVVGNLQKLLKFSALSTPTHATILTLLLRMHLGVGYARYLEGAKRQQVREEITQFLDSDNTDDNPAGYSELSAKEELWSLLTLLKELLKHSTDRHVRITGRDICESLQISLSLPQMLSLSIDGMGEVSTETSQQGSDQNDDVVLVIGVTSAGKSTLINYFTGVQYQRMKDASTGTIYLTPVPGQTPPPPARVGHNSKSQTLYPQKVQSTVGGMRFTYLDGSGFADNRTEAEAICASLGVPIAVKIHPGKIRAVIVVIPHAHTVVNNRDSAIVFRLLSHTLHELFGTTLQEWQNVKVSEGKQIPLLFAITRCPYPERNDIFRTDDLYNEIINSLKTIHNQNASTFDTLPEKINKLSEYHIRKNNLTVCIHELRANLGVDAHEKTLGWTVRLGAYFGSESDKAAVVRGAIDQAIHEQRVKWVDNHVPEFCISQLSQALKNVAEHVEACNFANTPEGVRKKQQEIEAKKQQQIDIWQQDIDRTQKDLEQLQIRVEEIQGIKTILELMLNNEKNVFIIRGYKEDNADQDDHRDELFKHLAMLRAQGQEIRRDQFFFNPNHQVFSAARDWARQYVSVINPVLEHLVRLPENIAQSQKQIHEKQCEIDETRKQLLLELKSGEASDHFLEYEKKTSLERNIEYQKDKIQQLENKIEDCKGEIKKREEVIKKIEEAPPVEYASRKMDLAVVRALDIVWSTSSGYHFPARREESFITKFINFFWWKSTDHSNAIIPIERVELSCVLDAEEKLVFRTEINDRVFEGDSFVDVAVVRPSAIVEERLPNVIEVKGGHKTDHTRGDLHIIACDLQKGNFQVKYYVPLGSHAGLAGIRVFVLPRYLPGNRETISQYRARCQSLDQSLKVQTNLLEKSRADLEYEEAYLDLMQRGLATGQDIRVGRVKNFFGKLGYPRNRVVKEFLFEGVYWLNNSGSLESLKALLDYSEETFQGALQSHMQVKINRQAWATILGENFDSEKKQKKEPLENINNILSNIHDGFIEKIYDVSKKTGLTISSIHDLLQALTHSHQQSLNTELEKLKLQHGMEQYCFEKLKSLYHHSSLSIRTLQILIEVLEFSENDDSHIAFFRHHLTMLKQQNTPDILYSPLEEDLKRLVESEIKGRGHFYDFSAKILLPKSVIDQTHEEYLRQYYRNARHGRNQHLRYIKRDAGQQLVGIVPDITDLLGQSPDNTQIKTFEEFEIQQDDSCFFHLLGVAREECAGLLRKFKEDTEVRKALSVEIINALKSNNLGLMETQETQILYSQYTECRDKLRQLKTDARELTQHLSLWSFNERENQDPPFSPLQRTRFGIKNLVSGVENAGLESSEFGEFVKAYEDFVSTFPKNISSESFSSVEQYKDYFYKYYKKYRVHIEACKKLAEVLESNFDFSATGQIRGDLFQKRHSRANEFYQMLGEKDKAFIGDLISGLLLEKILPGGYASLQFFAQALNDIQQLFQRCLKMVEDLQSAIDVEKNITDRINAYAESKIGYVNFVSSLGACGWLGLESKKLIARAQRINLYIWSHQEDSSNQLMLVNSHQAGINRPSIHLLYQLDTAQFNLLAEAMYDDEVALPSPAQIHDVFPTMDNADGEKEEVFPEAISPSPLPPPESLNLIRPPVPPMEMMTDATVAEQLAQLVNEIKQIVSQNHLMGEVLHALLKKVSSPSENTNDPNNNNRNEPVMLGPAIPEPAPDPVAPKPVINGKSDYANDPNNNNTSSPLLKALRETKENLTSGVVRQLSDLCAELEKQRKNQIDRWNQASAANKLIIEMDLNRLDREISDVKIMNDKMNWILGQHKEMIEKEITEGDLEKFAQERENIASEREGLLQKQKTENTANIIKIGTKLRWLDVYEISILRALVVCYKKFGEEEKLLGLNHQLCVLQGCVQGEINQEKGTLKKKKDSPHGKTSDLFSLPKSEEVQRNDGKENDINDNDYMDRGQAIVFAK